jgi:DNA-binding GntR family transcriptional regulator
MSNRTNLIKEWGRSRSQAKQIAATLGQRIISGDYAQHTMLPPESELADEFNVHRSTINAAKRLLGQPDHGFLYKVPSSGNWAVK